MPLRLSENGAILRHNKGDVIDDGNFFLYTHAVYSNGKASLAPTATKSRMMGKLEVNGALK